MCPHDMHLCWCVGLYSNVYIVSCQLYKPAFQLILLSEKVTELLSLASNDCAALYLRKV